jgi:uncharacterized protein (DUF2236 family)
LRQVALLGPDTVSWRVNREGVVLAGGGRALLLQVAHPQVAAGVEQHSDYQSDPWGRLYRTLDTTFKITFGDAPTAARAAARLQGRHRTVRGTDDTGAAYDARDPALLLWVWATLVETTVVVYERCVAPLSTADRERHYEEQQLFALACGIPDGAWPDGLAAFEDYYATMLADELRVTPAARAVAHAVVHPRVPGPLRPALAPNTLLTAGLLPPVLREEYGFTWGARRERLLGIALASLRLGGRATPRAVRHAPADWVATGRLDRARSRARGARRRLERPAAAVRAGGAQPVAVRRAPHRGSP